MLPEGVEGTMDSFRSEIEAHFPSTSEIAHIAALLAIGRERDSDFFNETVAKDAIQLWHQCSLEREDKIHDLALERYQIYHAVRPPKPEKYPVSFEDFLKYVFPHKRPEDRMKIYREFKRYELRYQGQFLPTGEIIPVEKVPEPSDDEVAKAIEERRMVGYNGEHNFNRAFRALKRFYEGYSAELRQERAKKGAAARKEKQKANG